MMILGTRCNLEGRWIPTTAETVVQHPVQACLPQVPHSASCGIHSVSFSYLCNKVFGFAKILSCHSITPSSIQGQTQVRNVCYRKSVTQEGVLVWEPFEIGVKCGVAV